MSTALSIRSALHLFLHMAAYYIVNVPLDPPFGALMQLDLNKMLILVLVWE